MGEETNYCYKVSARIAKALVLAQVAANKDKDAREKGEQEIRAFFGDKLPGNYKHVPGSVILVDPSGNPILKLNDDGTVSGLDAKVFYQGDNDAPTSSPMDLKTDPPITLNTNFLTTRDGDKISLNCDDFE